jgi:hypothetical protein
MWTTVSIDNSLPADHRHLAKLPITMEVRTPAEAREAEANPNIRWLRELREMRGKVIHDEKPYNLVFRSATGIFSDADPFDLQAHHVLVRISQRIVACARISPLDCSKPGFISTLLGQTRFHRILHDLGTPPELSCEGSRWVVAKDFRSLGLGPRAVAASWALVHSFGRHICFVLAGTRSGQDKLLCRLGAQPVHDVPTLPACDVNDEVRLMYFNGDPPKVIRKNFERAMQVLGLSNVSRES